MAHLRRSSVLLAILALLASLTLLAAPADAVSTPTTWSVVTSPNEADGGQTSLKSVSCISTTNCFGVGFWTSESLDGEDQTLIESWNGSVWKIVDSPDVGNGSALNSVSCTSATFCMAVGYDIPGGFSPQAVGAAFAERWNGKVWSVVSGVAQGDGSLYDDLVSVSCASSTACSAVGDYATDYSGGQPDSSYPLTDSWDGSSWTLESNPGDFETYLYGVSCVPVGTASSHCTLVGYTYTDSAVTLVETETDGGAYSVMKVPVTDVFLSSISCTDARDCSAAGSTNSGGTERSAPAVLTETDGTWHVATMPVITYTDPDSSGTILYGVSCTGPSICAAVGSTESATDTYVSANLSDDGHGWVVDPAPSTANDPFVLTGISCLAGLACEADGENGASSLVEANSATVTPQGYWLAGRQGGVVAAGTARSNLGSEAGKKLDKPIVGLVATPDGAGYWEVGADGRVFGFGDARFHGSEAGKKLPAPVVGMAATADDGGYWLVDSAGRITPFGDAKSYGSEAGKKLADPVVGIVRSADGHGYLEVGAGGAVYPFGDAKSYGSEAGKKLAEPIVGLTPSADGHGYLEVGAGGDVYPFGDAKAYGTLASRHVTATDVIGLAATPDHDGYWIAQRNGTVTAFGDATALPAPKGLAAAEPIAAIATAG